MQNKNIFDLKKVSVTYDETPVLCDISLRIEPGEKIAIIGPSGAGKTTLLRQLFELQQERAAFIHQDYALVPQLSAFHNVCIGRLDRHSVGRNLLNLIKPQRRELQEVAPILADLGMEEKILEPVHTLSGGQQQRVAVARAVYRGVDVLLGDEPVSSIDPHQANTVLQLIRERVSTVVLSLHDVGLALELFDRIIGLRAGRIEFDMTGDHVDRQMLAELYRPC